jgi:alpha-mannosidase
MVHAGRLPAAHSFLQVEAPNAVLSAVKKEAGYYNRALIFRIYETFGRKAEFRLELPWDAEAWTTDLVERPLEKIELDGKIVRLTLNPFEIKTLKIAALPRRTG